MRPLWGCSKAPFTGHGGRFQSIRVWAKPIGHWPWPAICRHGPKAAPPLRRLKRTGRNAVTRCRPSRRIRLAFRKHAPCSRKGAKGAKNDLIECCGVLRCGIWLYFRVLTATSCFPKDRTAVWRRTNAPIACKVETQNISSSLRPPRLCVKYAGAGAVSCRSYFWARRTT